MPLSSSRKKMGRKTFSFPLACPFPSPPKDIQHEGQCSCQSSLDGGSPLQQDFSCLNKLICRSDIRSLKKKQILWQFDSNTYRWERSSRLPRSPAWTTRQVAAYRPDPELLHRPGAGLARPTTPPGKTYHSTSIPSSQRAPLRGCVFLSDASSQKAFQKEASAILSKATNAVDWPLVNDKKNKFTGLEAGKRDLNECSYTGHYSNTLVAIPFLHRDRELRDQGFYKGRREERK